MVEIRLSDRSAAWLLFAAAQAAFLLASSFSASAFASAASLAFLAVSSAFKRDSSSAFLPLMRGLAGSAADADAATLAARAGFAAKAPPGRDKMFLSSVSAGGATSLNVLMPALSMYTHALKVAAGCATLVLCASAVNPKMVQLQIS